VKEIFRGELLELSVDDNERYAWIRRTARPVSSGGDNELERLAGAVAALRPSRMRLVVDLRRARARNDGAFEAQVVPAFHEIVAAFPHRAFLVATHAGKLQIQRVTGGAQVFVDEAEALRFAEGA
jgi:hypothetical protein